MGASRTLGPGGLGLWGAALRSGAPEALRDLSEAGVQPAGGTWPACCCCIYPMFCPYSFTMTEFSLVNFK